MKRIKTQKGITLIALIITIVVLLILAAVAIGAAQESNIVGYAQNAAGKYEQAKTNEATLLSNYEMLIDEYLEKDKTYIGLINGDEVVLVLSSSNEMTITSNGTVLANKTKPAEIPAPEGITNPENYSKFYKGTIAGTEMICGISKDGKTVTILGMGDLELYDENIFKIDSKTRIYSYVGLNNFDVIITKNGVYYLFINGYQVGKAENCYIAEGSFSTSTGINLGTFKNVLYANNQNIGVRIENPVKVYYFMDYTMNQGGKYEWIELKLNTKKTLADFGITE